MSSEFAYDGDRKTYDLTINNHSGHNRRFNTRAFYRLPNHWYVGEAINGVS